MTKYKLWVSNYSLDDITGGTEMLGKQFSKAMGLRYMSAAKVGLSDSPFFKRDNWFLSAQMDDWLRNIDGDIDTLIHNSVNCWTEGIDGIEKIEAEHKAVVMCENFLKESKAIEDVLPEYSHDKRLRDWPNQLYALKNKKIITISNGERETLLEQNIAKRKDVVVIEPFVDIDTFVPMNKTKCRKELGWSEEKRTLLYVGRAHLRKGWDLLLSAADAFPEYDFRCVAGKEDENQGNIHVHARINADTLIKMYNAADALIVPSRYESFGFTFAEAMACDTPILGTEVGLLENIGRDEALSEAHIRTFEPTVRGICNAISAHKDHMDLLTSRISSPFYGDKSNRKIAEKRFSEERFGRQCNELFGDGE
jgi:glycosyltransferase involved in cell wall biosynthesis